MPGCFCQRQHINAVHWAGVDAKITSRALVKDNGMHQFGCTDDGIDRAGLNALGAADAFVFTYKGDLLLAGDALFSIKGEGVTPEQIR